MNRIRVFAHLRNVKNLSTRVPHIGTPAAANPICCGSRVFAHLRFPGISMVAARGFGAIKQLRTEESHVAANISDLVSRLKKVRICPYPSIAGIDCIGQKGALS